MIAPITRHINTGPKIKEPRLMYSLQVGSNAVTKREVAKSRDADEREAKIKFSKMTYTKGAVKITNMFRENRASTNPKVIVRTPNSAFQAERSKP